MLGGEELQQLLKGHRREWNSNAHSLSIVKELELQYCEHKGLNPIWATQEGLARHQTRYDAPTGRGEYTKYRQPSLEAQVASISDPIAYSSHDLVDAFAAVTRPPKN